MTRRALSGVSTAVLSCLALAACENMPPPSAPPPQRESFGPFRAYRIQRVVSMTDTDVMEHVVADVLQPVNGWSWTGKHPMLKVKPRVVKDVQYVADLAIADATFQTTGPVTITFEVNGHKLDSVRYDKPGKFQYAHDVPAEWLEADKDALLGAEIDRVWTAPDDGAKLGFILTRIGLSER